MEADWDLYAIVRGSCNTLASTNPEPSSFLSNEPSEDFLFSEHLDFSSDCYSYSNTLNDLFQFQPRKDNDALLAQQTQVDQLVDLYRPFRFSSPSSPASPLLLQPNPTASLGVSSCNLQLQNSSAPITTNPRSKRRKNQLKKVRQVPADGLVSSDDTWSWRKYGQKPIKGSPYPRGYYRCSSLKGCPARKQVERNRTDPKMFIVTYSAEHSHPAPTQRNALAGTSRHQNQNKIKSDIHTTNSSTDVTTETKQRQEQLPSSSDEEVEAELVMMGLEENVDGGGCRTSELGDDFFDGLDGKIEMVGEGYWFP